MAGTLSEVFWLVKGSDANSKVTPRGVLERAPGRYDPMAIPSPNYPGYWACVFGFNFTKHVFDITLSNPRFQAASGRNPNMPHTPTSFPEVHAIDFLTYAQHPSPQGAVVVEDFHAEAGIEKHVDRHGFEIAKKYSHCAILAGLAGAPPTL
jgi:hypothetical protein